MAILRKKSDSNIPRRRMVQNDERAPAQSNDQNAFRRNRTLTGSTSNNISTSRHAQPDMLSSRTHAHRLARLRRRVGSVLLVVALVVAVLYWLLTQLTATVSITF